MHRCISCIGLVLEKHERARANALRHRAIEVGYCDRCAALVLICQNGGIVWMTESITFEKITIARIMKYVVDET